RHPILPDKVRLWGESDIMSVMPDPSRTMVLSRWNWQTGEPHFPAVPAVRSNEVCGDLVCAPDGRTVAVASSRTVSPSPLMVRIGRAVVTGPPAATLTTACVSRLRVRPGASSAVANGPRANTHGLGRGPAVAVL